MSTEKTHKIEIPQASLDRLRTLLREMDVEGPKDIVNGGLLEEMITTIFRKDPPPVLDKPKSELTYDDVHDWDEKKADWDRQTVTLELTEDQRDSARQTISKAAEKKKLKKVYADAYLCLAFNVT